MADKSKHVSIRVDAKIKVEAEHILQSMGISPSQAVKMLYVRVIQEKGWPCELKIPNEVTQKVFEETDCGKNLSTHTSVHEIFDELEQEIKKEKKIARRQKNKPVQEGS